MSATITLPSDYGYVILTTFSTFIISAWHSQRTASFRKAAKIPYPTPYASVEVAAKDDAAYAFNCAQRAHANFDENYAPVLAAMLISGIRYPFASSVLGGFWAVNRVVYAVGYRRREWGRNGNGRLYGYVGHMLAQLALYGMTAWTGWSMLG
ncbi:MAG: hypothetical protein M1835_001434 [Candelina submexicana]|nr:MAG: hypothetical protein M1835_001434 [Candelina submexicana]